MTTLQHLIEFIDEKQFFYILKNCSSQKTFSIPGFSNLSKISKSYFYKMIFNKPKLLNIFLINVVSVYTPDIDTGKIESTDSFNKVLSSENYCGIIAICLLKNTDEFNLYATTIIEQYLNPQNYIKTKEENNSENKEKQNRKEEKFREKYLEEQHKNIELKNQIDELSKTNDIITNKNTELAKQISILELEKNTLIKNIENLEGIIEEYKSTLEKNYQISKKQILIVGYNFWRDTSFSYLEIISQPNLFNIYDENYFLNYDIIFIHSSKITFAEKCYFEKNIGRQKIKYFNTYDELKRLLQEYDKK